MAPSSEPGGPLTPAMLTTINALAAQERRIYRRWTIIFAVLMVFWAVLFTVVLHSALMTFSVICAFFMLLFLIVGQIANRAAQRRMLDIAFVRTTGPIEVVPYQTRSAGGPITRYRLVMGQQQIQLDPQIAKSLETVSTGTAIYVPFTFGRKILLEVLDDRGEVIFRRNGYTP
jgi:hypothetical protein